MIDFIKLDYFCSLIFFPLPNVPPICAEQNFNTFGLRPRNKMNKAPFWESNLVNIGLKKPGQKLFEVLQSFLWCNSFYKISNKNLKQ